MHLHIDKGRTIGSIGQTQKNQEQDNRAASEYKHRTIATEGHLGREHNLGVYVTGPASRRQLDGSLEMGWVDRPWDRLFEMELWDFVRGEGEACLFVT